MAEFDSTSEQIKGNIKETVGKVTDDEHLEAEGKRDQVTGKLREAAEDTKDAVKRVFD